MVLSYVSAKELTHMATLDRMVRKTSEERMHVLNDQKDPPCEDLEEKHFRQREQLVERL